jgi:hypothetical protein
MSAVLLCTPYRFTTPDALLTNWKAQADRLKVDAVLWPDSGLAEASDGRYSSHARARNALLDAIDLSGYTHLYWVDIDIVTWPDGLLDWALRHNAEGISAPAVTLDHHPTRFYDILGYIEHGHGARLYPPWFDQLGPIVDLESVGCCYIAPTELYAAGARYQDTPGATEHLSVMHGARQQGRRILANTNYQAIHAYLPDYGEALH